MSKTILIIGGTSGIGLATARLLSANDNKIFSISRSDSNGNELAHVSYFTADVRNESINLDFLPNRIDGLVYCPGSINLKPFKSLRIDSFREDFELNVVGFVKVLQACIEKLKLSTSASVISFSTVAVGLGLSYHSSIASSKGAIEGLNRSLAAEYASTGIRFNTIAPSLVDTPLASQFTNSNARLDAISKRHPLNRIGNPEEVAALVEFLISDSSSWMTGQVIGLDGGLSAISTLG